MARLVGQKSRAHTPRLRPTHIARAHTLRDPAAHPRPPHIRRAYTIPCSAHTACRPAPISHRSFPRPRHVAPSERAVPLTAHLHLTFSISPHLQDRTHWASSGRARGEGERVRRGRGELDCVGWLARRVLGSMRRHSCWYPRLASAREQRSWAGTRRHVTWPPLAVCALALLHT